MCTHSAWDPPTAVNRKQYGNNQQFHPVKQDQWLWRKRNPFSQERLCLITSFISLWNLWITVITISNYLGISIKQKPQVWLIIITLHKPDRGKFSEIVVKGNSQTMRRSEINALQTYQPWILTYNSPVRSTVNILMSVVWIWIEREVLY